MALIVEIIREYIKITLACFKKGKKRNSKIRKGMFVMRMSVSEEDSGD